MNNQSNIFTLEKLCLVLIGHSDDVPTEIIIREKLDEARKICPVSDEEYDQVLKNLFERLRVTMDTGVVVYDKDSYKPWLFARNADIDFFYWNRFREYLEMTKGWNSRVISSLGSTTDKILDLLGNPISNNFWQRRGLVIGDVQSGKTATYTALCNKAMDAGYRVIIILAGTHENLRRQTQERLDMELVGLDSELVLDRLGRKLSKGVGIINGTRSVATFTSKINDFDQKILNNLNLRITTCTEPVVFVIKKQKHRLQYLATWLKTYNAGEDGLINQPMLLIDDEADNASVNTKDEDDPTAINEKIRILLALFTKASYVGITATPYANIFIDPESNKEMLDDDLFPRDFVYALDHPSNYIGNGAIFGENATHEYMLHEIKDAETYIPLKHKKDFIVEELPPSLYDALNNFLLVNAVRDFYSQTNTHRSMMINISWLTNVQSQIKDIIQEWLDRVKREVQNYCGYEPEKACHNPIINKLKTVWDSFDLSRISGTDWKNIQQNFLYKAIAPIIVTEVNQKTGSASLDYTRYKEIGLRVIAIGGNSLSRGLTLEDLCVSYFYRNSQMYDTLLQMGRWFGYRSNYDRLCQIWMTEQAQECFSHITKATKELKEEINYMNNCNMTPKQFGLMVRSHPDSIERRMVTKLIVTARNKMKHTSEFVYMVSVSCKLLETPRIINDYPKILSNFNNFKRFVLNLDDHKKVIDELIYTGTRHNMWTNIPNTEVATLIRGIYTDPLYSAFSSESIANYIENADHLKLWDIAIPEGSSEREITFKDTITIRLQRRIVDIGPNQRAIRINKGKARVGSRPCTKYGLLKKEIDEIEKNRNPDKQISDKEFLKDPNRKPLLILHFIGIDPDGDDIKEVNERLKSDNACLVAIGIGFPGFAEDESKQIRYVINKIKQQQLEDAIKETEDEDE